MIIKGGSRTGGATLGAYLVNAKNENAQVIEVRGTVADDPRGALIEIEAYSAGTRCEKPIYHAMISPEPPHRLTRDQMLEAADLLEERLGLQGQARVVVAHEHEGREHLHVAWSRIDLGQMRAVHMSHNYRRHELVSRELEDRWGHDHVQGVHVGREGPNGEKTPRPDRTPSRSELRQEERTGIRGKDVKAEVTAAFRASDGPEAFRAALADQGYTLAFGDRRDFVIVDYAGGIHSLARRIDGVNAAGLREFMQPLDRDSIPTIGEVKSLLREQAPREVANELAGDDEALRRLREHKAQYEADGGYGSRADYVHQSEAAGRDAERRQELLRQRELERQRDAAAAEVVTPQNTREASPTIELSDDAQAAYDRLRAAKLDVSEPRGGPDRQNGAPGGGHTRSR